MTRLFTELAIVAAAHLWIAWLTTWIAHSAVLVLAVWAICRSTRLAADDESALWRLALTAPMVTATASSLFGLDTPASFPLPALVPADVSLWRASAVMLAVLPAWSLLLWWRRHRARRILDTAFAERTAAPADIERDVHEMAARFGIRSMRVTISSRAASPAVIGPHELCLPTRFATWSPSARTALLAHELSHVARRDPQWLRVSWFVERACPAPWLLRFAARSLHAASERAADDRAVGMIGDARTLAEALTTVAADVVDTPGAVAASGSPLVARIERLLNDRPAASRLRAPSFCALAVALVVITACAAPSVRLTPDDAANRVTWLRPSSEPPNHRMLVVRYATRRVGRFLHFTR